MSYRAKFSRTFLKSGINYLRKLKKELRSPLKLFF